MCFDYDEIAKASEESRPVARKQHKCCECIGKIEPGERYISLFLIFDSGPKRYKTCLRCESVRQHVHDYEIEEGCGESHSWPAFGFLRDEIIDADGHYDLWRIDRETNECWVKPLAAHLFPLSAVVSEFPQRHEVKE